MNIFKKSIFALALLTAIKLQSMDCSMYKPAALIKWVKPEHLIHFKLFTDEDEAKAALANPMFSDEQEEVHFSELMHLLSECIPLAQAASMISVLSDEQETGDFTELMNTLSEKVLYTNETYAQEMIVKHIQDKQLSVNQIIAYYDKINYLEIELLRDPIVIVALDTMIKKYTEGDAQDVQHFNESLSLSYALKKMFLHKYPAEVWSLCNTTPSDDHDKRLPIQADSFVKITNNGKYLLSYSKNAYQLSVYTLPNFECITTIQLPQNYGKKLFCVAIC